MMNRLHILNQESLTGANILFTTCRSFSELHIHENIDFKNHKFRSRYTAKQMIKITKQPERYCQISRHKITFLLPYHYHSEHLPLGCKISTNLLLPVSKCYVKIKQQGWLKSFKMAEQSDDHNLETLLAPSTRNNRLQRTITRDYFCFLYLSLFRGNSVSRSANGHIHRMTEHSPASLPIPTTSLRGVPACDDREFAFTQLKKLLKKGPRGKVFERGKGELQ